MFLKSQSLSILALHVMGNKYPLLSYSQVIKILKAHSFTHKRTRGSHEAWEGYVGGRRRVVTVDNKIKTYGKDLIKSMIVQSGLTRDEFYESR